MPARDERGREQPLGGARPRASLTLSEGAGGRLADASDPPAEGPAAHPAAPAGCQGRPRQGSRSALARSSPREAGLGPTQRWTPGPGQCPPHSRPLNAGSAGPPPGLALGRLPAAPHLHPQCWFSPCTVKQEVIPRLPRDTRPTAAAPPPPAREEAAWGHLSGGPSLGVRDKCLPICCPPPSHTLGQLC